MNLEPIATSLPISRLRRRGLAALALTGGALLLLSGCAGASQGSEQASTPESSASASASSSASGTSSSSGGDQGDSSDSGSAALGSSNGNDSANPVTGTKSQQEIIAEIEKDFSDEKTQFSWSGNTLTMTLDGDATENNAGGAECGKLEHIIKAGTEIVLKFPNGEVNCNTVITN